MNSSKMKEMCVKYRGQYIEFVAMMESVIDEIIVEHFCGGDAVKKDELMHVILVTDKITLMSKWLIVKFIYEAYFPEINKWFNTANKSEKTMYNTVIEIIQNRNKIAQEYINLPKKKYSHLWHNYKFDKKEESKGSIINKPCC